jgi:diadenosine tetraphosphate (Ap4A) HIT family hydrolase
MAQATETWMPRDRWDALVRGDDCPLCRACSSRENADAHGYTIADLKICRLRLAINQFVPGYCVLICSRHVSEPYHLSRDEQTRFFDDLMLAAQAVETVFNPIKMNFELLGNLVPHLHAHIVPRYYGDPAPERPIDPDARVVTLTEAQYIERVQSIRAALKRADK